MLPMFVLATTGLLTDSTMWLMLPIGVLSITACLWSWKLIGDYYADKLSPRLTALLDGLKWSTLAFFILLEVFRTWADGDTRKVEEGFFLAVVLSFLVVFLPLALKPILLGRLRTRKAKKAQARAREHMLQTLLHGRPERSGGLLDRWFSGGSDRTMGRAIGRKVFIQVVAAAISGTFSHEGI